MRKKRKNEKKNGRRLEFKIHHISCETSNKTPVSGTDRICGVFFGPPEAGMGGGSRQVEWSPHTEIFIFAAISRATNARFFNVFISLDSSFH